MDQPRPAALLLSGGLDSSTVLAIALSEGYACHCLTVDYGQRHRTELDAAERIASQLGAASHRLVAVDLRSIGGSALTADIEVPLTQRESEVLKQLALGLTNKEIAQSLGISYETVKEHVQHILRKVGVSDRTQAAVWAVREGLV